MASPKFQDGPDYFRVGQEKYVKPKSYGLFVFLLLALLGITCFPLASCRLSSMGLGLNITKESPNFEYVETELGAVAADDTRCSKVGAQILTDGGNAVDAAVATVLCSGVVNPTESSIGGGSFMMIRIARRNRIYALDMRETAPAAATENMFKPEEVEFKGPKAMGVPGEIKGLYQAHKRFGRLEWSHLFAPAIKYARYGFEVYPYLAQYAEEYRDDIFADPGLKAILAPNGEILKAGETCYREKLADTLEEIAIRGSRVFYRGWIAEKLVEDTRKEGGIMTMDDLRNYKVNIREVMEVDFLGYKLFGMPPPSSGTIALSMVSKILRGYGDNAKIKKALEGDLGRHRLVETLKHVLAARMNLGDPIDFGNEVSDAITLMNSTIFGRQTWRRIDDTKTFPAEYYQKSWKQLEDHGTCHQSIVDKDRNAVSITTSLNYHFGARFLSPSTGMIVNNQLGDFSFAGEKNHPNRCQPNKRPLSSMTPLIIFKDDKFVGVVGGTGGSNIIASVTQTVLGHFVLDRHPVFAVHDARVYPKLSKTDLNYDDLKVYITGEHIVLDDETIDYLEERGHVLSPTKYSAYCHFIVRKPVLFAPGRRVGNTDIDIITAVSDIRKGAKPAAQKPARLLEGSSAYE